MTVTRHESELGFFENVQRAPADQLRGIAKAYHGYTQDAAGNAAVQRHVPGTGVTIIIGFEAAMRSRSRHVAPVEHRSFVAGLHDVHVITENTGVSAGVQVDLTPVGAYLLLGRPMHEIANKVVSLEDAFGADGPLLAEALYCVRAWDVRFDLLDEALGARMAHARPASPGVVWAWRTIEAAGGNVSIASLGERLGWSRKHLVSQFREQVGLPPKTFARIARFGRAIEMVRRGEELRWTEVAHACGYYDQAHFIRDFSEFAGVSPTRFLDLRLPLGAMMGD
jgi:AraC-like DNA-binding protein